MPILRPTLGPFDLRDERSMAVLLLILVGVVALLIRNLQRSPSGRAMLAVRSAERAAACSGVSPVFTKLALFAVSAAVAGVGGVMLGAVNGNVTNTSTPATVGLIWLATVVLFGIRRPAGAIVAGLVAAATPQILSGGFHWPSPVPSFLSWNGTQSVWLPQLLFGLGAIQLARSQDGVLALTAAQSRARRRKRQARRVERLRAVEDAAVSAEVGDRGEELLRLGALRRSGPPAAQHPGSGPAALALAGVRAGYGDLQVLRGVDLEVRAGSITALLGANGAGKSTLCSVISGTVVPTGGGVLLRGEDVTGRPPHLRFRDGVILAPEGRGVFPGLSVEENLALRLRGAKERERAYERFPALAQRRKVLAGSLSGGEQQMLTLAAVVVSPPDVVVADEPTLGLAPLVVRPLMELFRELRDRGSAALLVEEKIRDVLGVADRVAFIELGHIVWAGERSEIDDERLIAAYLGAGIG